MQKSFVSTSVNELRALSEIQHSIVGLVNVVELVEFPIFSSKLPPANERVIEGVMVRSSGYPLAMFLGCCRRGRLNTL